MSSSGMPNSTGSLCRPASKPRKAGTFSSKIHPFSTVKCPSMHTRKETACSDSIRRRISQNVVQCRRAGASLIENHIKKLINREMLTVDGAFQIVFSCLNRDLRWLRASEAPEAYNALVSNLHPHWFRSRPNIGKFAILSDTCLSLHWTLASPVIVAIISSQTNLRSSVSSTLHLQVEYFKNLHTIQRLSRHKRSCKEQLLDATAYLTRSPGSYTRLSVSMKHRYGSCEEKADADSARLGRVCGAYIVFFCNFV